MTVKHANVKGKAPKPPKAPKECESGDADIDKTYVHSGITAKITGDYVRKELEPRAPSKDHHFHWDAANTNAQETIQRLKSLYSQLDRIISILMTLGVLTVGLLLAGLFIR